MTESGTTYDLDVIVCATGFDVSHVPHYPVTGRNGIILAQKWANEPESYLSVACPDMPNYFIFTGPNATVGHGTLLTSMTWTAGYICKWLEKIAGEGIKSVAPTEPATREFVRYGDEIHKSLTWTGGCKSWYKVSSHLNSRRGRLAFLFTLVMPPYVFKTNNKTESSRRWKGHGHVAWVGTSVSRSHSERDTGKSSRSRFPSNSGLIHRVLCRAKTSTSDTPAGTVGRVY